MAGCAAPAGAASTSAAMQEEAQTTPEAMVVTLGIAPTPTPEPTPVPTPVPTPSPEPTGRALLAYELEQKERAYFAQHPVEGRDLEELLASLRIDPEKKLVALTFDDGPSKKHTMRILDVLERYNARATFFIVGERIEEHAEVLERTISLNCEVGSHTWGHGNFADRKTSELVSSLKKVDDAMQKGFGYHMRLFRPPYGSITANVKAGAVEMGYPMVLWSGSTHDWSNRNADKIYNLALACAADGAIILFHDIYDATAEATERLVPEFIEQGYQLVTVSELICMGGVPVPPGARYGGWAESSEPGG